MAPTVPSVTMDNPIPMDPCLLLPHLNVLNAIINDQVHRRVDPGCFMGAATKEPNVPIATSAMLKFQTHRQKALPVLSRTP